MNQRRQRQELVQRAGTWRVTIRSTLACLLVLVTVDSAGAAEQAAEVIYPGGGMTWIDWLILLAYASATILLGWYFSRRQRTAQEYFTGSGHMNPILIGISLFATLLSTTTYLSYPGEVIGKGPVYLVNFLAYPLIFLVVGYVILPVYMRQRVTSAYELLEDRLGLSVRMLGAGMFIVLRLVWMSLLIYLTAKALSIMLGLDERFVPLIALVTGFVAVVYTSLGGLRRS